MSLRSLSIQASGEEGVDKISQKRFFIKIVKASEDVGHWGGGAKIL